MKIVANPHISGGVRFTPDGKVIAYPIRENGVDNVWVQPLDGSAGHQITYFTSEQIDSFHKSPDGKSLAYYGATRNQMWYCCRNPDSKAVFAPCKDSDTDIPILIVNQTSEI